MHKSMTFNGQRNDDIYLLEGRSKSPFHSVSRDISRVGKHHRLRKTEKELLPIKQPVGFVNENDETQMEVIERLTDWLITDDWVVLSFDDEPGRSYMAMLQNDMSDFERIVTSRKGTLEFVAKATLGSEKTLTIGITQKAHTIGGQESTPWTSRAVFGSNANQYTLETGSGGKIILDFGFISGDVLTIDYDQREVKLNGDSLMTAVNLKTRWFELKPGQMHLKASHKTEIVYTERFY